MLPPRARGVVSLDSSTSVDSVGPVASVAVAAWSDKHDDDVDDDDDDDLLMISCCIMSLITSCTMSTSFSPYVFVVTSWSSPTAAADAVWC